PDPNVLLPRVIVRILGDDSPRPEPTLGGELERGVVGPVSVGLRLNVADQPLPKLGALGVVVLDGPHLDRWPGLALVARNLPAMLPQEIDLVARALAALLSLG